MESMQTLYKYFWMKCTGKRGRLLLIKVEGVWSSKVKPIYDCEDCPDLHTACELKRIKWTTHRKDAVLIGTYYREPKPSIEALQQLGLSTSKIFKSAKKKKNSQIFLRWDFNLGDINWTMGCSTQGARDKSHCDKLVSMLNCYGLDQVNTLPTHQRRVQLSECSRALAKIP